MWVIAPTHIWVFVRCSEMSLKKIKILVPAESEFLGLGQESVFNLRFNLKENLKAGHVLDARVSVGSGLGWGLGAGGLGAGLLTGVRWNCPTPFSPHWSIYSDRCVKTDPSFYFLFSLKYTHKSQWPFYCQISVQLQLFSFFALRSFLCFPSSLLFFSSL